VIPQLIDEEPCPRRNPSILQR